MFAVFSSNAITVDNQAKQGTIEICICTYTIYSFKTTNEYTGYVSTSYYFLLNTVCIKW